MTNSSVQNSETVVLDLDNTLICSSRDKLTVEEDFQVKCHGCRYYIYFRPGLNEFIDKILESFRNVYIMTMSKFEYAKQICNYLFEPDELTKITIFSSESFGVQMKKNLALIPYDNLTIYDDNPSIYLYTSKNTCFKEVSYYDLPDILCGGNSIEF